MFIGLIVSFVAVASTYNLHTANQLETKLFSCHDISEKCSQIEVNSSIDSPQVDEYEMSEFIFNYLTEEAGYPEIQIANFNATTSLTYVPPYFLGSGLSGGDDRNGYYPLICPQNYCYQGYDSVILVDLEPVLHLWSIERDSLSLSAMGLMITGKEVQELIVVPGAKETFGIAEHPELLETARNNQNNLIWQKHLDYEIVCTLNECTKSYKHN